MLHHNMPPNELHFGRGKDNHYHDQISRVYEAFYFAPMTMKEADKFCGVMRENICWYVRDLKHSDRIRLIGKRYCRVTKHLAGIYTTNPELFPTDPQLKLPL